MPRDAMPTPPFLIGANLPWVHYGIDFGANAWRPEGGVSQPEESEQLDKTFAQLAASGARYVRWFLFCDGRAGIRFSDGCRPLGIDDFVFRDLDAALETAARHGIRIMFALLDFLLCKPASVTHGVQMGGRTAMLADARTREALLDLVLKPVLERYGDEPQILAWDIINEPEWISTVDAVDMRGFLEDGIALIHSSTCHPATVGSAGVRWRDRYRGIGLDFYQVHWYDGLRHQPPLDTPVEQLGFDRPVLLGEFPTKGSTRSADEIVEAARAAGYSGAFYWSVLARDECSAGCWEARPGLRTT